VLARNGETGMTLASSNTMRNERLHETRSKLPKVLVTGSVILAGLLTRKATRHSWALLADEPPPDNPADPEVGWKEAVAFTVGTAVVVGLARLLARREMTRRVGRFA
jgi:hypothetical protein